MNASERSMAAGKQSRGGREPIPQAFVVMERGSRWPAHVDRRAAGCVAVKQEFDEVADALLRRACDRVRAIERGGHSVELAVLSCSGDPAEAALEDRAPLAEALLASVLHGHGGRLVLTAPSDASAALRRGHLRLRVRLLRVSAGAPEMPYASKDELAASIREDLPPRSASTGRR